jgi:hypothetical protein
MPNIEFVGYHQEFADEIIGCLNKLIPEIMNDAVYLAQPDGAPRSATTKEFMPYIKVTSSETSKALQIKDTIQGIHCNIDGMKDIEVHLCQFFPGDGKIPEDPTGR